MHGSRPIQLKTLPYPITDRDLEYLLQRMGVVFDNEEGFTKKSALGKAGVIAGMTRLRDYNMTFSDKIPERKFDLEYERHPISSSLKSLAEKACGMKPRVLLRAIKEILDDNSEDVNSVRKFSDFILADIRKIAKNYVVSSKAGAEEKEPFDLLAKEISLGGAYYLCKKLSEQRKVYSKGRGGSSASEILKRFREHLKTAGQRTQIAEIAFSELRNMPRLTNEELNRLISERKELKRGTKEFEEITTRILGSVYPLILRNAFKAFFRLFFLVQSGRIRVGISLDECITIGVGMAERCIEIYDPSLKTPFFAYLVNSFSHLSGRIIREHGIHQDIKYVAHSLDDDLGDGENGEKIDFYVDDVGAYTGVAKDQNGLSWSFVESHGELLEKVQKAIDGLPIKKQRDKEILELSLIEGLGYAEIARIKDLTRQRVHQLVKHWRNNRIFKEHLRWYGLGQHENI